MNLLQCSKEFWNEIEAINREADETGEMPIDAAERLDKASSNYVEKLANAALAYKSLNATAATIKDESKRLAERADRVERQAEYLRKYIEMSLPPGEKYEDARVSLKWRKSEAVKVTNILDVPPEYWRETVTREPDKRKLAPALKALKPGEMIPGAILEQRMNLQIE